MKIQTESGHITITYAMGTIVIRTFDNGGQMNSFEYMTDEELLGLLDIWHKSKSARKAKNE